MKKIGFVLLAFLAGCSYVNRHHLENEGRVFIDKYPGHVLAIERSVKERNILPGMTMEEVLQSWGKSTSIKNIRISRDFYVQWIYVKIEKEKIVNIDCLYFKDGILIFWKD